MNSLLRLGGPALLALSIASPASGQIAKTTQVMNLFFGQVTALAYEPGNPNRWYAGNKTGRVFLVENNVVVATPWLDMSSSGTGAVNETGEGGLLGVACHPDFQNNGKIYVSYTTGAGLGDSIISEFTRQAGNPDEADLASERIIFGPIAQNTDGHKAGGLEFGPDGKLYYSLGDGWAGGVNVDDRAQDITEPRGSILRFDPDLPYPHIPPDNPLVGVPFAAEEIYAIGLRNPFRFGIDRLNGDLYIGDVGQSEAEELNHVPYMTFQNFGWPCREGAACYPNAPASCTDCNLPAFQDPIFEYDHNAGDFVAIGGPVYRGSAIPALYGYAIYADFAAGQPSPSVWAVKQVNGLAEDVLVLTSQLSMAGSSSTIVAIEEDEAGELYLVEHYSGRVFKVEPDCGATTYCQPVANSTGVAGGIAMSGTTQVSANSFGLVASDLPPGQFAYFLASQSNGYSIGPGGSQGNLCVSGHIGRYNAFVGQVDGAGNYAIPVDLGNIPTSPPSSVVAGDTWYFQCWHRDFNPSPTSNFTPGLAVTFCP
jgi:glucose/arabinose dehydrogenase